MRTRPFGSALVAVAVAALLLGCSGDDDTLADTESIDSSSPGAGESGESGDAGEPGEADDDSESPDDGGSGEVLGTARATLRANAIDDRSTPIRIDVTRLERHGDLVELTLELTNEVEPAPDGSDPQDFQIYSIFGDHNTSYNASGIGLVDGDAQKLYLPVVDSNDVCLCSDGFANVDTPPGGTLTISATYGGVGDGVEALDVRIPNFPVITGVPVS